MLVPPTASWIGLKAVFRFSHVRLRKRILTTVSKQEG